MVLVYDSESANVSSSRDKFQVFFKKYPTSRQCIFVWLCIRVFISITDGKHWTKENET